MAAEPVFIDTNVLVYAGGTLSPHSVAAREALERLQGAGCTLWISPQVIREYLAAVTRPQATVPAMPMAEALKDARGFASLFNMAGEGTAVLDRLLRLLASCPGSGKQVHDANLVATMLETGIRHLLTFNTSDFRRFGDLIELEPL